MMSPDDLAESPPGYLARHESGHAAAFLSLSIPLDSDLRHSGVVTTQSLWPEGVGDGPAVAG
jgi:hypothetical protein